MKQYLVETYETRVADKQKKKLLAPLPISEDMKITLSSTKRDWGASWWQQYSILFWRGLKERRHDYLSWMRITQVLAIAVILGLLWWHSNIATQIGQEDQVRTLSTLHAILENTIINTIHENNNSKTIIE